MQRLRLSTVGAVCAILTPILFFAGGILLGTSSGQDLIPQTGADGLEWIADVDDACDLFFVGAWLIVLVTLVGSVALVGFYDVLKGAGPVRVLAPILGVTGLVMVTISHLSRLRSRTSSCRATSARSRRSRHRSRLPSTRSPTSR